MKSTKKKEKAEPATIKVISVQPNILVKHDGIKYKFTTESVELPINVAKYFIEKGIVNSTKEE